MATRCQVELFTRMIDGRERRHKGLFGPHACFLTLQPPPLQFENSNEVGVFANLTNAYCIVALGGAENFYRCAAGGGGKRWRAGKRACAALQLFAVCTNCSYYNPIAFGAACLRQIWRITFP